jgi:predicted metal-binding membrane protein
LRIADCGLILDCELRIAALILIGAGAYQFTSTKANCLGRCRSPFSMLLHHWKTGAAGALRMGLNHGASCVACCWPLMLVLFIVGVMNIVWVVFLTAVVAFEKLAPSSTWPRWIVGAALIVWGVLRSMW